MFTPDGEVSGVLKRQIMHILKIREVLTVDELQPHLPTTARGQIVRALRDLTRLNIVKSRIQGGIGHFRLKGTAKTAKLDPRRPKHADGQTAIFKAEPKPSISWWAGKSREAFMDAHKERFRA